MPARTRPAEDSVPGAADAATAYWPGTQRRPLRPARGRSRAGCRGGACGARRRRAARAGAAPPELRVGQLQLGERVADLRGVGPEQRLDQRQQRPRAVDRQPHLLEVALVLGARRQAGLAAAEVQQRDDRLDEDVLDAQRLSSAS